MSTTWLEQIPRQVTIVDVGPRDGLQNIMPFLPTEDKIWLVNALARAGLKRIEATSFVHPQAIPQLQDAETLMRGIDRRAGVRYIALIPNLRGAERALASNVDELTLVVSASESHNYSNVRRSIASSLEGFVPVMALAKQAGVFVRGGIATAFGCPFEGKVAPERVIFIAARFLELGADEIVLNDTVGMGNPAQVASLLRLVRESLPAIALSIHLHNTRGAGLANALAALQAGVTVFEASVGGLGGCPFAPGATGNVCTEDLVNMLEQMGIHTGVDLAALIEVAKKLQEMLGQELPSQVMKAGPSDRIHPRPS